MKIAISMAKRGIGTTAPNPSVGCVIVKDDKIIAKAVTAKGGRPHAETIALKEAGKSANGSTLYVTLEPCSHQGKTPPCVDAIIKSKIKKVVIANLDVNPKVNGSGIAKLKKAGIEVIKGICEDEAHEINYPFFKSIAEKKPYIILKLGTSIDGKIALKNGKSHYVTGELARRFCFMLRAKNDAVIVGSRTYDLDEPQLNCRIDGLEESSPQKIVLGKVKKLREGFLNYTTHNLKEFFSSLLAKGHYRIMVEGGGKLAASLLKEDMIDEIYLIKSGKIFGGDATPSIAEMGLEKIPEAKFKLSNHQQLGDDIIINYRKV